MGKKTKVTKKEKTALAKMEKKLSNKMTKELQARGEDDIENILAEIQKEEKKRSQVSEVTVDPPSRRVNFSFAAHPNEDQLILYGGEYFDGKKAIVYKDLFFYNIPNNKWTSVKAPAGPPPRCGHQMVVTPANQGQLWIFGGEYASPTQSQFYHYKDLWTYHITSRRWEKITAPNGPSARSGHRMVYLKNQLIIFGGFYDNLRHYKYFNDIYSFNTETYEWSKLEPTGKPPSPRSGGCMVALEDNRVLIFGGYSRDRLKKKGKKGQVHTDAFLLTPHKNDITGTKFKWVRVKIGGIRYFPRCSMTVTTTTMNNSAYVYGGVYDIEDEENITSSFFNDFYQLDLETLSWRNVTLTGNRDSKARIRKNKNDSDNDDIGNYSNQMKIDKTEEIIISDDGIFKVTVASAPSVTGSTFTSNDEQVPKLCQPSPRINCGLVIKHGILYLYGGMFEKGNKQVTFSDFYALDLKKLDQWKILIPGLSEMEWLGSDSEESEEEDSEDESVSDD